MRQLGSDSSSGMVAVIASEKLIIGGAVEQSDILGANVAEW